MKAALTALDSFSEIFLWVLKDNKRAIAFYQKMGFTFDGQEKMLELGKPIKEKRMVFYSNTLRKSNSNHVSFTLPYSSTACG